jgi:hypothetical protein
MSERFEVEKSTAYVGFVRKIVESVAICGKKPK